MNKRRVSHTVMRADCMLLSHAGTSCNITYWPAVTKKTQFSIIHDSHTTRKTDGSVAAAVAVSCVHLSVAHTPWLIRQDVSRREEGHLFCRKQISRPFIVSFEFADAALRR